jgi:hypothetical protein
MVEAEDGDASKASSRRLKSKTMVNSGWQAEIRRYRIPPLLLCPVLVQPKSGRLLKLCSPSTARSSILLNRHLGLSPTNHVVEGRKWKYNSR